MTCYAAAGVAGARLHYGTLSLLREQWQRRHPLERAVDFIRQRRYIRRATALREGLDDDD